MKRTTALLTLLLFIGLVGCGQKGPLFIPDQPQAKTSAYD